MINMGGFKLDAPEIERGFLEDATKRLREYRQHVDGVTVVDIGAHCGAYAMAAWKAGARQVTAVEGCLENYNRLWKAVEINGSGNMVLPLHRAVVSSWNMDPVVRLTRPAEYGNSGMWSIERPDGVTVRTSFACATSLSDVLALSADDKVILKIDIEGAEYDLFDDKENIELLQDKVLLLDIDMHKELLGVGRPQGRLQSMYDLAECLNDAGFEEIVATDKGTWSFNSGVAS